MQKAITQIGNVPIKIKKILSSNVFEDARTH